MMEQRCQRNEVTVEHVRVVGKPPSIHTTAVVVGSSWQYVLKYFN